VTEKLLVIKSNIKDDSNNYLDNFKDIYRKINYLRYLENCYGLSFMLVNLVVNPDLAIAKERLYQDYFQDCQILLSERPDLAKKLAIDLILREQAWFASHVDIIENIFVSLL
jgi:hypothetical protein